VSFFLPCSKLFNAVNLSYCSTSLFSAQIGEWLLKMGVCVGYLL
jgi:hypothetical protein